MYKIDISEKDKPFANIDVDKDKINELIRMLSGDIKDDEDAASAIACTLEYLDFLSKSFD